MEGLRRPDSDGSEDTQVYRGASEVWAWVMLVLGRVKVLTYEPNMYDMCE